jgi:hypothetical protein
LKAGKQTQLETERGLFSRTPSKIPRPRQTDNRLLRISDAEQQLKILESQDQIFEEEKLVEEELLESERILTEEEDIQIDRILSPMGENKQMVVPWTRDAPKFLSTRPRELRRFIRQLEDLWREARVEADQEKKESLGKYADQESEEEWKALETYGDGYTWEDFKKEILENYPEASAAERGTPARIRQIVKEADGIELGDTTKLYAYRRAFLSEANKLKKAPAVMSNRELVELFMGGFALSLGQAVLQYLGSTKKIAENKDKGNQSSSTQDAGRRPEDKYDLEEVCKAAGEVCENAQGMLSYRWAPASLPKRGSSLVQGSTSTGAESATSIVFNKLESLEGTQAMEKDKLDAVNKQWGVRLDNIENMMKSLLNQNQEKVSGFVQSMGQGNGGRFYGESLTAKSPKNPLGTVDYVCYGCG